MGRISSEGFDSDPLGVWTVFAGSGVWVPLEPDSVLLAFAANPPMTPSQEPARASLADEVAVQGAPSWVACGSMTSALGCG